MSEADGYVIVHPNWWGQPPAVLKGWIDRVLRQGVAYEFGPEGVVAKLAGRRAVVFTTSNTPREEELRRFGDPLENLWQTCIFAFCGVETFVRRNFEPVILSTPDGAGRVARRGSPHGPRAVRAMKGTVPFSWNENWDSPRCEAASGYSLIPSMPGSQVQR